MAASTTGAVVRVGTSGWAYAHWKDAFYPPGLRLADRFAHYASVFDTVELNGTFYRMPSETAVANWALTAPEGFVFAWKASQYITHAKKLRDPGDPLALLAARYALLGDRLGPVLYQLPPQLKADPERLAAFLALLPRRRRHTVEFRHPSWYSPQILRLLADHDVALCISDHHDAPSPWEATASFVYIRGHGPGGRYVGRYPPGELQTWAERIRGWMAAGVDAYVYFDNDIGVAAPVDALSLRDQLTAARASRTTAA